MVLGCGKLLIASTLDGRGFTPDEDMECPRKETSVRPN